MKKFLFFLAFSLNSFASPIALVQSGDVIDPAIVNELVSKLNSLSEEIQQLKKEELSVGTIVTSILSEVQYISQNGDCWKLAEGNTLSQTDELQSQMGVNALPNAKSEGLFFRQAKPGRVVGTVEQDELKSHNHTFDNIAVFRIGSGGYGHAKTSWYVGPNHHPSVGYTGGEETRPKNLAVNTFIKFKKQCNFSN